MPHLFSETFSIRVVQACVLSCFSCVRLFATPWTLAHQAPLSMEFFRQEYWIGLPFPTPGFHPNPGIEPRSLALQADSLLLLSLGKPDLDTKCVHCQWGVTASRPSQWADLGNKTIDNPHTYICIFLCVCANEKAGTGGEKLAVWINSRSIIWGFNQTRRSWLWVCGYENIPAHNWIPSVLNGPVMCGRTTFEKTWIPFHE